MTAQRKAGASRSLLFINTLLLSSAIALPAMAQIEEVVVTAQKKTEDVQSVPIAVTAFTGQDLKTQQIEQFKDLQFHAPNVTYTAGNFGGADFQIRGIGVTAVGYDAESGVAINFDEVYLSAPQLTEGSFYDLSGIEVLAGPQSTLYGRGATGGVVNLNIAKPDLENPMVQVVGDFGNYDLTKVQGTFNVPIVTDELALRVAGEWDKRDGYVTNLYNGEKVDSLDQYSVRPTLRWQPSEKTTIDITGEFTKEDDSHMRADKQLCTTDPTGILGCLPQSAGKQPLNPYATLSDIYSSQQAISGFLQSSFGLPLATAQALGAEMGLFNLQAPVPTIPGYIDPSGARQIDTDFTPIWHSQDNFLSAKWHQTILPWLDGTLIGGYDHDSYFSQESYNNIPGSAFPYSTVAGAAACATPVLGGNGALGTAGYIPGAPNIQCAAQTVLGFAGTLAETAYLTGLGFVPPTFTGASPAQLAAAATFGSNYANLYAPYFSRVTASGPGSELPISGIGNLGTVGGNYTFTPNNEAFDQSDGESSEYSAELRFNTSFNGPLNAMLGFYYLHTVVTGDYYVNASTLDYPGILVGALGGAFNPTCYATGCLLAPTYYHNVGEQSTLTSKAVFGEVYYTLIPDTLKLTGGIRLTDDDKFNTGRILLYSGFTPIGTTSESFYPESPPPPTNPDGFIPVSEHYTAWTGRGVIDWTPKLDFTDQTLVYLSYSTGYKAGGANPNIEPGLPVAQEYSPENIVAYEVGTKNMILNNTLQANGDVYYYDYKGLQVSTIQYNTSVNDNIAAHVWGAEGSLVWQATDRLQFTFNAAHEESNIQNTSLVDPANPTGGNPNTLLIKDDTITANGGENCVLYYTGAATPLPSGYIAPVGGEHALAAYGIPNVAFGSCNPAALAAAAAASGGAIAPVSATGAQSYEGQAVSLDGHSLVNTPQLSFSVGGQYTQPLPGDYSLILRTDVHFQTHMWGSIFEDGAAFIPNEYVWDASLQVNPPEDLWYVQLWIKNITNQNNITGQYVTSQTSGLYTNAFYGDPRTFGVELGIKFD
jgi:iron complex outermembrane recepter protein